MRGCARVCQNRFRSQDMLHACSGMNYYLGLEMEMNNLNLCTAPNIQYTGTPMQWLGRGGAQFLHGVVMNIVIVHGVAHLCPEVAISTPWSTACPDTAQIESCKSSIDWQASD